MTVKDKVVVDRNPHNGKWDVGWRHADGEFTPHFAGIPPNKPPKLKSPALIRA